jgi:transcription elongation factor Elf1
MMEIAERIQCPFCGEESTVSVDTTVASQQLVTDCEICCRPLTLRIESTPGEILSLEVSGS